MNSNKEKLKKERNIMFVVVCIWIFVALLNGFSLIKEYSNIVLITFLLNVICAILFSVVVYKKNQELKK